METYIIIAIPHLNRKGRLVYYRIGSTILSSNSKWKGENRLKYPRIVTDRNKLKANLTYMSEKLGQHQLSFMAVTKVFSAHPEIIKLYEACSGLKYLGDSRIENLESYQQARQEKVLIRIPMQSEVDAVVQYADISFNSELATIDCLNKAAAKRETVHRIVLMVDLGDLREGYYYEEQLLADVEKIKAFSSIKIVGLAVNLTCYGAVIPEEENLSRLTLYKEKVEALLGYELDIISGGNSSSFYLLDDETQQMPAGINNLRMGEALVLGKETAYSQTIKEMHQDVFKLEAELVEIKEKPSLPTGRIGVNAFGEAPEFEDKGMMRRGIISIGKQDVSPDSIVPMDREIEILGASSDHMILDLTHATTAYQVGDKISFELEYGSLLTCFTSQYVKKEFI